MPSTKLVDKMLAASLPSILRTLCKPGASVPWLTITRYRMAVSLRHCVYRTALLCVETIIVFTYVRYKQIVANGNYSSVNGSNYFDN